MSTYLFLLIQTIQNEHPYGYLLVYSLEFLEARSPATELMAIGYMSLFLGITKLFSKL